MLDDNTNMDTDSPVDPSPPTKSVPWSPDTSITAFSEELFSHLKDYQAKASDQGEDEPELPEYKNPNDQITSTIKVNQRMRFNLIRHRGTVADIPSLKLFKSFTSTLKKVDPSIFILPYLSSKQHYSSLVTLKRIENMEENKLPIF
jgi:hypothetical protein